MAQAVIQELQAALDSGEQPAVAQVDYGLLLYAANLPHLPINVVAANDADGAGFLAHFPDNILALGSGRRRAAWAPVHGGRHLSAL